MSDKFSLDNFKKWMRQHKDDSVLKPQSRLVGLSVECKIPAKQLVEKILTKNDDLLETLADEFCENGGTIKDVDQKRFLIEVQSGEFFVHRAYVRRA